MATSKIEKVTNDSGSNYCKMPDGTLMCWGSVSDTASANSMEEVEITFPVDFIQNPSLTAIIRAWTDPRLLSVLRKTSFRDSGILRVSNISSQAMDFSIEWIAIGRWK